MLNRTPYPSRCFLIIPSSDVLNNDILVEKALEEVLRFCRIDIPDQDEPLTYEWVEELLRERGIVEFPRYKPLLDLIVRNDDTNIALARAHEPGVFDGDVDYSLLWGMRAIRVRLLCKVGDLMLLATLTSTRSTVRIKK